MEVSIQELSQAELPEMATVHLAAFPEGLLTRLGGDVVSRYYNWQLSGVNEAVAVAARSGGQMLGFALGGIFKDSLNGFFRANRTLIAAALLRRPWLLFDPLLWSRWRLLSTSLRRSRRRNSTRVEVIPTPDVQPAARKPPRYVILSIGTHPRHRRKGVAAQLLTYHENRARELGHERIWLSVRRSNDGAISFYQSQGWAPFPQASTQTTTKMTKVLTTAQ